jgi:hypothetical protein
MIPNIVQKIYERNVESRFSNIQDDISLVIGDICFANFFANDSVFVIFFKGDTVKVIVFVGDIEITIVLKLKF